MASKAHQFIAMCILRKIREKGYEIIAFEGDYTKVDTIPFHIPPQIIHHRPDILGIKRDTLDLCIGEAKTAKDLFTKRTKEQLSDYISLMSSNIFNNCELIIGIPQSAERKLKKLLVNLNIFNTKNLSYLMIPKNVIPKGNANEEI